MTTSCDILTHTGATCVGRTPDIDWGRPLMVDTRLVGPLAPM